jgi:hypothetical protein
MNAEDIALMDRAIKSEHDLTDEKFRSRDLAIALLAGNKQFYIAITLSVIIPIVLHFWK